MSSFLILRCPEIPAIFRSQIISAVYPKDSFFVLFFSLSRTPIYLGNLFITTCRMLFYCCLLCEKYDQNSLLLPVSPRSSRRSHTEPTWVTSHSSIDHSPSGLLYRKCTHAPIDSHFKRSAVLNSGAK